MSWNKRGGTNLIGTGITPISAHITLGTKERPFKDLYVSSNSIYVGGNKTIYGDADLLNFASGLNQSIGVSSLGTGKVLINSASETHITSPIINLASDDIQMSSKPIINGFKVLTEEDEVTAGNLITDPDHRLVTDVDIANWNQKTNVASSIINGHINIDGVDTKVYELIQDPSNRLVSDAQINLWTNKTRVTYVSNGKVNLDGTETTIYAHPVGDGNLHVPATGVDNNGKYLKAGSLEGTIAWSSIYIPELLGVLNDTQHGSRGGGSLHALATQSASGFQSAGDKAKQDSQAVGATKTEASNVNGNVKINGSEIIVYTHPSTHVAAMITTDSTRRFVSDTQITSWNARESTLNKNMPNGYPGLGADGKMSMDQLPDLSREKTYFVNDEAERLALTGLVQGDRCYEILTSFSYIWDGVQWQQTSTGGNIAISWDKIGDRPTASTYQIDVAASQAHVHANQLILDRTTSSFTTEQETKLAALKTDVSKVKFSDNNGNLIVDNVEKAVYTHPATDGFLHVPETGTESEGKYLRAGSTEGSIAWDEITSEDIGETTSKQFVSEADKARWEAKQDLLSYNPEDQAKKDEPFGYAGLDEFGKIVEAQLPSAMNRVWRLEVNEFPDSEKLPNAIDGDIAIVPTSSEIIESYALVYGVWTLMSKSDSNNVSVNNEGSGVIQLDGTDKVVYAHPTGDGNSHVPSTSGAELGMVLSIFADTPRSKAVRWERLAFNRFDSSDSISSDQHGAKGGGTLHALVDASSAGFMSPQHFDKVEAIEDGATATPYPITSETEPTGTQKEGQVWYKASTEETKIYLGGEYRNVASAGGGGNLRTSRTVYSHTPDTAISSLDISSQSYDSNEDLLDVYLDNLLLLQGDNYTTSGSVITFSGFTVSPTQKITVVIWKQVDSTLTTISGSIITDGTVSDEKIGTRVVIPTIAPTGSTGTITELLSGITNRLKAHAGTTNWYDTPTTTLNDALSKTNGGTIQGLVFMKQGFSIDEGTTRGGVGKINDDMMMYSYAGLKFSSKQSVAGAPKTMLNINQNGNVQIGIDAPTDIAGGFNVNRTYLSVYGRTGAGVLELAQRDTDYWGAQIGQLQFTDTNSTSEEKRVAGIVATVEGVTANNRGGVLSFYTKPDDGGTGDYLERGRFDSGGRLHAFNGAIVHGTNSFTLAGADHTYMGFYPNGPLGLRGAYLGFGEPGGSNFSIFNQLAGDIIFASNNTQALTIKPNAVVQVEKTINLPAATGDTNYWGQINSSAKVRFGNGKAWQGIIAQDLCVSGTSVYPTEPPLGGIYTSGGMNSNGDITFIVPPVGVANRGIILNNGVSAKGASMKFVNNTPYVYWGNSSWNSAFVIETIGGSRTTDSNGIALKAPMVIIDSEVFKIPTVTADPVNNMVGAIWLRTDL